MKLIEWILQLKDDKTIDKMLELADSEDWGNEISEKEKAIIMKSYDDIANGNVSEHSEVRKMYANHK
ncbi:MAG: hypothetical protein JXR53_04185 [Bacteroidales bacterium]|nr:hypothetical protein [Bacteroidales bacterium]